jgi:stage II sporulation protein D
MKEFMRRIVFPAIMIIVFIIVCCRSVLGGESRIIMRVALSVTPPFQFYLKEDACVFPLTPTEYKDMDKGLLYKGESTDQQMTLTRSNSPFTIKTDNILKEIILCCPSGESVSFFDGLRIEPVRYGCSSFQIGDRCYPGGLQISYGISQSGSPEIIIINLVDLETYTEGVLAGEVYSTWAPEALKAQAVASRTYALRQKFEKASCSFDVDDTVLSQVYTGENQIRAFKDAVHETYGEVLIYEDIPIKAHYFSSGGGKTEGDEEVWLGGSNEPYLIAREDFDWMSPYYRWDKPLVLKGEDLFKKIGLPLNGSGWIEPSIRSGDKILAYNFRTGDKTVSFTREQIRHRIGLASPRFDIAVRKSDGQEIIINGIKEIKSSTVLVFDGVGSGHGVGLSQWGAQGMALMCTRDGTPIYDYIDILQHYYPGTELVDNYNISRGDITLASCNPPQFVYDSDEKDVKTGDTVPPDICGDDREYTQTVRNYHIRFMLY